MERGNCWFGKMAVHRATSAQSWIHCFSIHVPAINKGTDYGNMSISAVGQLDVKTGMTLSSRALQAVLHSRKVQYSTGLNMLFNSIYYPFETAFKVCFSCQHSKVLNP